MSKAVALIFPHQLFKDHKIYELDIPVYLVEEYLFFKQYNFHKIKLAFHRASMKKHADYLSVLGIDIKYIPSTDEKSDIRKLLKFLITNQNVNELHFINPTDYWLELRIKTSLKNKKIKIEEYENPLFLNSRDELNTFFKKDKKSFYQTTFYKQQRKKRNILIDENGSPIGGKWSFDQDNRKKYPKSKTPPKLPSIKGSEYWQEAIEYVGKHYGKNLGSVSSHPKYCIDHQSSEDWLDGFLKTRFNEFGDYEDAIVAEENILNHSVLSPLINSGLLSPNLVVNKALDFASKHDVNLNSVEGFIRQIIGWREFIRGMYECKGIHSRNNNFWNFERKIPASFYDGTTGIDPIDITIKKVLETGYCHHIERLMVLGNFMLLCEFDPNEVYKWFMELFIDAYDWVMVPNVYGMTQFADGGLFATKPYISSSNYLMKMSDYNKGEWQTIWDGLFWRFMNKQRDFFLSNPRLGMLISTYDKMDKERKDKLNEVANSYLQSL